jgi:hypothetical protein
MVYALESEPHCESVRWSQADFRMWYNLDLSYPAPATYIGPKTFLTDLLSPPRVPFHLKSEQAHIVWVISNCNAYNGRQKFVKNLMKHVSIDSYGICLRNKFTHTSERMIGNVELFAKYKFVMAIENSNCNDYVTEKLVHAISSGSVPIVAGKDGKPDYLRFLPKNSYINIYDFESVETLAQHIKKVAQNKELYEKMIYFRLNHQFSKQQLGKLAFEEIVELTKKLLDPEDSFGMVANGILAKLKHEDKLCKVARHLRDTPKETLFNQIREKRIERPSVDQACLPSGNLAKDFSLF